MSYQQNKGLTMELRIQVWVSILIKYNKLHYGGIHPHVRIISKR